jgi:hypothetical protein
MTTRRNRSLLGLVSGAAISLAVLLPAGGASAAATGNGTTWRINLSQTGGLDLNKPSTRARISQDGKHACFQTAATNVTPGDPSRPDIFWTDFTNPAAPVTKIVSIGWNGAAANDQSTFCELSADGNTVVFSSLATNLVQGSTQRGVFVRNMSTGVTKAVAKNADRPVISDDGSLVAYNTLSPDFNVVVTQLSTGTSLIVTQHTGSTGDAESLRPEISGDGNFLIFASDLKLTSNDQNTERDVYRADLRPWRTTGSTASPPLVLVSVGTNGLAAGKGSSRPGINHDGSVVSFASNAANLVVGDTNGQTDAFVRDYRTNPAGVTTLVSYRKDGTIGNSVGSRPQLDDSGNIVAFVSTAAQIVSGDTNNKEDAFVRNWFAEKGKDLTVAANRRTFMLAVAPNGDSGVCPGVANQDEGTKAISTRPYLSGNGLTAVFVTADCNLATDAAHGGPDTNLFSDIYVRRYPSI